MKIYAIFRWMMVSLSVFFFSGAYSQSSIVEQFQLRTSDSITLAGEIAYPSKTGKYPAVMLVWGNGPHTRDDSISGSPLFKQLAAFLVDQGMLVLRMDKRGFGASQGVVTRSEGNYTTLNLVEDFELALSWLQKHPHVDGTKLGVIGHSEGSIIVPILLSRQPTLSWGISFGPVGVSGADIIKEQTRLNRKSLGMSPEISNAVGLVWDEYIQFVKNGYSNDSLYLEIGSRFLQAHGLAKDDKRITPAFINQLLDEYLSPWYQYFFNTDVSTYIRQLKVPYLVVFAADDAQTTVHQNLLPIYDALQASGNKDFRIVVMSDEDHFFARFQDQRKEKHEYGRMEISGRFLRLCQDWLKERAIIPTKNGRK